MNRTLILCVTLFACSSESTGEFPPTDRTTPQTEFDLTWDADRAWFEERDLAYRESVGPYAVYEVIGEDPALLGPRVTWDRSATSYGMLCGTAGYFAAVPAEAERVIAQLRGGEAGEERLVSTTLAPRAAGTCTAAADDFGERIKPDGGDDSDGDTHYATTDRLVVVLEPAPAPGSRVLLRRLAVLVEAPGHNGSHVISPICCNDESCGLDEVPEDGGTPELQ